jgi:hypothetical protein
MGLITPTFTETNGGKSPVRITPAHEPLQGETPPSAKGKAAIQPEMPKAPVVEPQPIKVALIGTAPSSRMLAPFNDPTWKIWACSPGNQGVLPRVDVWFELHGNLLWPENVNYGGPYIEWLKTLTIPVYMQDQRYCPNATTYPKDEMIKEFGKDFFTSSFSWMMALAISQGAKELSLYGIDMASRDEYILQRPGFYFFKHIAESRGIKVSAPHESDIMQPPGLYGYSEVTPFGRKILAREKEIRDRVAGMEQERANKVAQLDHSIAYLKGALEDLDYVKSIWLGQG